MAAASQYTSKLVLDWLLGGTTGTTGTGTSRFLGLAWGTPGSAAGNGSELGTLTGYTRMTVTFMSASTAGMSASNAAAVTFGAFSSVGSAIGVLVCENQTVGSTNIILQGTLQTARTFGVGDSLVFAAGALTVTLT